MSSFGRPHRMYLFEMRNGKRKLAYGETPEDALVILGYRLTPAEMDEIIPDRHVRIHQRDLQSWISRLG